MLAGRFQKFFKGRTSGEAALTAHNEEREAFRVWGADDAGRGVPARRRTLENHMYKNYIFDLYGTLVDIHTDEESPLLWEKMAAFYSVYGADYKPAELRRTYIRMVAEEEKAMRQTRTDDLYCPEIDLGIVFSRLLLEAPRTHECREIIPEIMPDDVGAFCAGSQSANKAAYMPADDRERERHLVQALSGSGWLTAVANVFRIISRDKLKLYPHTKQALDRLKAEGKGIYLLSNAQALFTFPELESTGLLPYFDGIYISSACGVKKPDPSFMRRLLAEQRLDPEESVMIGNDYDSDLGVAKAAGVDSMFLNTYAKTKEETEAAVRRLQERFQNDARCRLIMDGDIAEIL